MVDEVQYFGYGANRDPEMIKAIIGRLPIGYPAKFYGFELCVQTWKEMPQNVRDILTSSWDPSFRTYCARATNNSSLYIKGTVWELTREERRIIDSWELTGIWYKMYVMQYQKTSNHLTQVEIQVINDPGIKQVKIGHRYKTFLNNKEKMLQVAHKNRKWFYKHQ